MGKLHIQLIMPSEKILDDVVDSVILPGIEGDFEILDEHSPFITQLRPGTIKVIKEGEDEEPLFFAIHDGFITVEDNEILVLSEDCERKDKIDLPRAEAAKERAEKRLADISNDKIDFRRAEAALKRAVSRINTAHQIA
jgi:F-type H+-transporting ATPase subunit epsilon